MILIFLVVALIAPVVAAVKGCAYRGVYFALMLALPFIGGVLLVIAVDEFGRAIAASCIVASVSCLFAGILYRAPRPRQG